MIVPCPSWKRRRLVALAALVVLAATACDPGLVSLVAGTGTSGSAGDGGPATSATFVTPSAITPIPGGGEYVLDKGACVVRRIDASGTVTTVAGDGTCGFSGDGGPATSAELRPSNPSYPSITGEVAVDSLGRLYVADAGNRRIRRVALDGTISTIAGDGTGNVELSTCSGSTNNAILSVAVAPDDTVYAGCAAGIAEVQPDGSLTEVLSAGMYNYYTAMTVDPHGNLWAAHMSSWSPGQPSIVERTPDGTVTTQLTTPSLHPPTSLAVDAAGDVYAAYGPITYPLLVLDSGYNATAADDVVARLTPDPATIAGTGHPDPGGRVQTGHGTEIDLTPGGIALASDGKLLVTSGHVLYSLDTPAGAQPWSGSVCTPSNPSTAGEDLAGLDLAGLDLHGCDFASTDLSNTDLTGTILTGANLDGADLQGATLVSVHASGVTGTPVNLPTGWQVVSGYLIGPGADLSGFDLSGLDLSGATLTGANLTGAVLTRVHASGVIGTPADLPTGWQVVSGYLIGPGADLSGFDLSGLDLSGATLTGANLTGANLTGTNLDGTDLQGATLDGAHASGVTGTPADLPTGWQVVSGYLIGPGADLSGLDLTGADLSGANLSGATIDGTTTLAGAILTDVNLSGATLDNAVFDSLDLAGANLSGTHLVQTSFTGANLSGADLTGATMRSTAMTNADLTSAVLNGIVSDTAASTVDLTGADLTDVRIDHSSGLYAPVLTGSTLAGADLSGLRLLSGSSQLVSGGISGTPATLPTAWGLLGGYLVCSHCDISGLDLIGADLTGAKLSRVDLSGMDLSGANLTGADLTSATLTGANLAGTNFDGATLTDLKVCTIAVGGVPATLPPGWATSSTSSATYLYGPGVDASGCDLSGADLTGAHLTDAYLVGTDLTGADLTGADLTSAVLTNATLEGANLNGTMLAAYSLNGLRVCAIASGGTPASLPSGWFTVSTASGPHLLGPGVVATDCDLTGADLTSANLTSSNLTGANLTGVNLTNADLTSADLWAATLEGANLDGTRLAAYSVLNLNVCAIASGGTPASLPSGWFTVSTASGLHLLGPGVAARNCDLTGADLTSANLTGANLTSSNLTSADLTGANLTGASVAFAYLTGADLTNATLTNANLSHSNLNHSNTNGADFTGTNLAARARRPRGRLSDQPPRRLGAAQRLPGRPERLRRRVQHDRRRPVRRGPHRRVAQPLQPHQHQPVGHHPDEHRPHLGEVHRRHRKPHRRLDRDLLGHHLPRRHHRHRTRHLRRPRLRQLTSGGQAGPAAHGNRSTAVAISDFTVSNSGESGSIWT